MAPCIRTSPTCAEVSRLLCTSALKAVSRGRGACGCFYGAGSGGACNSSMSWGCVGLPECWTGKMHKACLSMCWCPQPAFSAAAVFVVGSLCLRSHPHGTIQTMGGGDVWALSRYLGGFCSHCGVFSRPGSQMLFGHACRFGILTRCNIGYASRRLSVSHPTTRM